ncbi:MAG: type IIL restriction-modification enzyme MmeI, partial [Paracoccaceae bacterium]
DEAQALGLGSAPGLERHIRAYRNGRDLAATSRGLMVIDLFGLTESEVRTRFPAVYQHVLDNVKPERDQNNRATRRNNWWLFGEPLSTFRPALDGVKRYIATVETSKYRVFQFLDASILPDNKLIVLALANSEDFAVLSSRMHVVFSLAAGSWLGVGNDPVYAKTKCFDPFPFPTRTEAQTTHLRHLGEQLDAHRKAQQAAHPKLTLTAMYNVLEKLRAGERIEGKDREIYDQGLIGILADLHRQIDTAVAAAYGWPADLSDDDILHRLVALNAERAREESQGLIRWLRPDYQNPAGRAAIAKDVQSDMDLGAAAPVAKVAWPKTLPDQMAAVQKALISLGVATPEQIAREFARGRAASVQPLLETLASVGLARMGDDGRYAV